MLEERVLDLPMREADVAIRMKEPSQADLIRKRGDRHLTEAIPVEGRHRVIEDPQFRLAH